MLITAFTLDPAISIARAHTPRFSQLSTVFESAEIGDRAKFYLAEHETSFTNSFNNFNPAYVNSA